MLIYTPLQIQEMKLQYHRLISGGSVSVVIDQNGERIEYARGDAQRLWAYILAAEAQSQTASLKAMRPLSFMFK